MLAAGLDPFIVDLICLSLAFILLIAIMTSCSFINSSPKRLSRITRRVVHYGSTQTSVEIFDGNLRGRCSRDVSFGSDKGFLITQDEETGDPLGLEPS